MSFASHVNLALSCGLCRPKLARLHILAAIDCAVASGKPELAWQVANLLEALP